MTQGEVTSNRAAGAGESAGRVASVLVIVIVLVGLAVSLDTATVSGGVVVALPFYAAGLVILRKLGSNLIGWLLLTIGVTLQVTTFDSIPWLPDIWLAWITNWGFHALFAQFTWLLVLFPDAAPTRSGRVIGWSAFVLVLGGVFAPVLTDVDDSTIVLGPNPVGIGVLPAGIGAATNLGIIALLVIAAVGVVIRGRRSEPDLAARFKPVLVAMAVLGMAIGVLLVAILIDPKFTDRHGSVVWGVVLVVYMLIPASFVVAITRYHLYDIDRIVSRSVTYALVALVVIVVYSVPVVLLPRLLGESDQLIVAGSTLVAAAVFNPVRRRIQRSVDRRFNRSAYDLEFETDRLARRLADLTDLSAVRGQLDSIVGRALAPRSSSVWIRSRS